MSIYSSVVEYNPLHFGHMHHLNCIKSFEDFQGVLVVMSGNFVQRGETAIVDKWARTEMAIKSGVDLVLELPFVYAIQDARGFALGSISTLEKTGIVDKFVFGSESDNLEELKSTAKILLNEPEELKSIMKKYLKEGLSFPNARKLALKDYTKGRLSDIDTSNDILGVEYIYSLMKLKSSIKPLTIKRQGAAYNDSKIQKEFSSASAIRKHIKDNANIDINIPNITKEILKREFKSGKGPVFYDQIQDWILSVLVCKNKDELKKYHGVTEGLENRIKKFLPKVESLNELLDKVKTKRFTYSRLKRTILNIVFEITKEDVVRFNEYGPQYIKVLGFNDTGKELLAKMRKNAIVPIINLPSQFYRTKRLPEDVNHEVFKRTFELELKATQIYKLLFSNKNLRRTYTDFRQPIYIANRKDQI